MIKQLIPLVPPIRQFGRPCSWLSREAPGFLGKGQLAYVPHTAGLPNAVFARPFISAPDLFAWLQLGEVVQLLSEPRPHRSMGLVRIRSLVRHIVGWTSAGSAEECYLFPIMERQLCDSTLPSRLQIGDIVGVVDVCSRPISLLHTPTPLVSGGMPIGSVFANTTVTIINGPACFSDENSGQTFWQVRTDLGQEGWIAECNHDTYWLQPLWVKR